MPRKYNNKKRNYKNRRNYRKKRSFNRYRKGKFTALHAKQLGGFPDAAFVKVRHTKTFILAPGIVGDAVASFTYYGNYPQAPFKTASTIGVVPTAADIPINYQTWSNIYSRQMTLACKITVRAVAGENDGATASTQNALIASDHEGAGFPGPFTIQQISGNPYNKTRVMTAISAQQSMYMKRYMKSTRMFGTKLDLTDHSSSSAIGSLPAQLWYYTYQVNTLDQSSDPYLYMQVVATYYIKFFERKNELA